MTWVAVLCVILAYVFGRWEGYMRGYIAQPVDQCGDFLREKFEKVRIYRKFADVDAVSTSRVEWNGSAFKVMIEPSAPLRVGKQEEE